MRLWRPFTRPPKPGLYHGRGGGLIGTPPTQDFRPTEPYTGHFAAGLTRRVDCSGSIHWYPQNHLLPLTSPAAVRRSHSARVTIPCVL